MNETVSPLKIFHIIGGKEITCINKRWGKNWKKQSKTDLKNQANKNKTPTINHNNRSCTQPTAIWFLVEFIVRIKIHNVYGIIVVINYDIVKNKYNRNKMKLKIYFFKKWASKKQVTGSKHNLHEKCIFYRVHMGSFQDNRY